MTHRPITDPEVLAFIARTEAAYPAEANEADAEGNRRYYDAMCAVFRAPRPAGVAVEDVALGGVPCRRYRPEGAEGLVMYAHGGGMVVGGLDSHDDVCAELAAATGAEVVAVDYRLAPEHPAPAQIDDVAAVWTALDRDGVVAGDSAGGTLVAGLCHRMKRTGGLMPRGQVLVYPGLGGDGSALSYRENAEAPLLRASDVLVYRALMPPALARDPEHLPLLAVDFTGLPAAAILAADVDPLRDDATAYAAALRAAGVPALLRNDAQLVHGWLRARHSSRRAARAFAAFCAAVATLLRFDATA